MNQPWIYMLSPSRTPLPPPSPSYPSGSSQCTSPEHPSEVFKRNQWPHSICLVPIIWRLVYWFMGLAGNLGEYQERGPVWITNHSFLVCEAGSNEDSKQVLSCCSHHRLPLTDQGSAISFFKFGQDLIWHFVPLRGIKRKVLESLQTTKSLGNGRFGEGLKFKVGSVSGSSF